MTPRVLLIDNYDSFTHNLAQALGRLGAKVLIHRNDAITLDEARALAPTHVVLSPGPGHPGNARDFGVCDQVLKAMGPVTPTLGVCLGHQGIAHHLGGQVKRAPAIVHGKSSRILHHGRGLFAGLPQNMEVMRYHSLVAPGDTLPDTLEVTAHTEDGLVMAIAHRAWPVFGVQFHPESIGTPQGDLLLANFLAMSAPDTKTPTHTHESAPSATHTKVKGEREGDPMAVALAALLSGQGLTRAQAEAVMGQMMDGASNPVQTSALLTALALTGETVEALTGMAAAMRARMVPVSTEGPVLDTCGTGGSGLSTANTSTMSAFVLAADGVRVAKHGNRASSGRCGSSDVLEALGVHIEVGPEHAAQLIKEVGVALLFAPRYHPAVRHVVPVRRQIGFRTAFNFLGPLCNPAAATHQLLGVSDKRRAPLMARTLAALGSQRAMLVRGEDGLDELTLNGPSRVWAMTPDGELDERIFHPAEAGLEVTAFEGFSGGDRETNARIFVEVLSGRDQGPHAQHLALNAGAALHLMGRAESIAAGAQRALAILRSGAAMEVFEAYKRASHQAPDAATRQASSGGAS